MGYQLALEATRFEDDSLLRLADTRPLAKVSFRILHAAFVNILSESFEAEGIPSWQPLADFTIRERLQLGFNEGPILVRTGSLRESFLSEQHPMHVYDVELGETMSTLRVGSEDPRAVPLAKGDAEQNLPARPIFPDGTLIFPVMSLHLDADAEALYG